MAAPRLEGHAIHRAPTEAMQITERLAGSLSARPPDFIALVAKTPRSLLQSSPATRMHACGASSQMIENGCTSACRRLVDLGHINGPY
ncbi:hypothetical protein MTO96_010386 [Rhipicephalus appendiculatus]